MSSPTRTVCGEERMISTFSKKLLRDRRGTTAVELGVICVCIVLVLFAGLKPMANKIVGFWNDSKEEVTSSTTAE